MDFKVAVGAQLSGKYPLELLMTQRKETVSLFSNRVCFLVSFTLLIE